MRFPLQIFQPAQKCYGVIPSTSEQTAVFFIDGGKQCPFVYKLAECVTIFQKALHLDFNFRETTLGRIGQRGQGEIPGILGFVAEFPSGINQGLCQLDSLKVLHPVKLALGHVPPQIQQLPDALCRLLPCDKGGIPLLDGAPGGNADAIRIIPDGVFPILNKKPRAVGAVTLL